MYVSNLILEVTRQCNMKCDHCLRGPAQKGAYMSTAVMHEVLKHIDHIDSVCFSGGEPTLNLPIIKDFLHITAWNNIYIDSFYIVTNGKVYKKDLVKICDELYNRCYEKELCGLAVSDDIFHAAHRNENKFRKNRYRYLIDEEYDYDRPYVHLRDKRHPDYPIGLIDMGRAKTNHLGGRRYSPDGCCVSDEGIDGELYITYDGKMVIGCNWSYKEADKRAFGDVFHFGDSIEKLKALYPEESE